MTPRELVEKMLAASRALDVAQEELVAAAHEDARAGMESRKAQANAYLAIDKGTIEDRKHRVNKVAEREMYAAHLADGLHKAARLNVQNKQAQLSALQSVAQSVRAEATLAMTGGGP